MQIDAKVKYKELEKVINALTDDIAVKVGILAKDGNEEVSKNLDMAGLGAVHEFGCQIPVTDKMRGFFRHHFGINLRKDTTHIVIPSRSFLQKPLEKSKKFMKNIKSAIGDAEDVLYYIQKTGDIESLAIVIGGSAVDLIQEAFDTSCWGEWEPDKELTVSNKIKKEEQRETAKPLINTGYLRSKINYEVEKR